MAEVTVRKATAADLEEFYQGMPPATMRAYVALVDGKPVGVGGLALSGLSKARAVPEAFCEVRDELKPHIRNGAVQRGILAILKLIRAHPKSVVAIADPEIPGAPALLTRLGAVFVGSCSEGEVYQWHK
jgi:hypothetical protein